MNREAARQRHLIFIAHLGICAPFLLAWFLFPQYRAHINQDQYAMVGKITLGVIFYLGLRVLLAFKDPVWLPWEYVFPVVDALAIAVLIKGGSADPVSHVSLLYLFPLAEAAGTLSLAWSIGVATIILAVTFITTGFHTEEPFTVAFRYFFFFIFASLATMLARVAAANRAQVSLMEDRSRMAMEMHDGVQGHLVALASQLELVGQLIPRNQDKATQLAEDSRQTAREAADELRYLVSRLRQGNQHQGLSEALTQYVFNFCRRTGLEAKIEIDELEGLKPEVEHVLFRVTQEFLTKTHRNAVATEFSICLRWVSNQLILDMKDNGKGFEAAESTSGLESMKTRIADVGGTSAMDSTLRAGTSLHASIPKAEALL